ncbi:MAG: hypothetical protein HDT14_02920 [Oscillibacter sp.]|nr:hypothetical protein [Oscillibacter sp.]
MKKRWLATLLALVLTVSLLPVTAYAAAVQDKAGANLTPAEQQIYDAMAARAAEVAAGTTASTQISIFFEEGELSWTAREMGLSRITDENLVNPLHEKVGEMLDRIYTCLELNLPFEMFWANNYWNWIWYQEHTGSEVWITGLDYSIDVTPAYQGRNTITTDVSKITQANSVIATAKAIVQANEGKSDYEKLAAYRDEICARNTYNRDAYQTMLKDKDPYGPDHTYGDPWQLIYVFDGDPDTNVLCEGYSKAFKYLCDLSEFNGDVTCYLAEGLMNGEKHMWNVVRMGDGNFYLADVTNSDEGMSGENGGLFLTEASGSGQKYVVSHDNWKITYIYREDQEGLFTDGYLPISAAAYLPDNDVPAPAAPAAPVDPPAPAFTDVTYSWLVDPVAWALEHDVTNGITETTFEPDAECTHAQILTFLYRAERSVNGTPAPAAAEDMNAAIEWAREQGMIDDSFDRGAPCTRSQSVRYIWLALGSPSAGASGFTDVPADAAYARAVDWAAEKEVTKGDGGADIFNPEKACSRGQIITFLYRAYH